MSSHAPNQARVIPFRPVAAAAAPAATPTPTPAADKPVADRPVAEEPKAKEPLWRHIVGDVLRRERLAQERTLKDVAEAARISMPYLSELERGRKEASSEVLAAAAHALGLGLADILALGQTELARAARPRPLRSRTTRVPEASARIPEASVRARGGAGLASVSELRPRHIGRPMTTRLYEAHLAAA